MLKRQKKSINQPPNRMVRDYFIWDSHENLGKSNKEIAAEIGISLSSVSHVLKTCEMLARVGDVANYFDLAIEIADVLDNAGLDPDKCAAHVVRAIWIEGYTSRLKIAAMTPDEIERVSHSKRMRRAGYVARDAFLIWQEEASALNKKVAKAKKSEKTTKTDKIEKTTKIAKTTKTKKTAK